MLIRQNHIKINKDKAHLMELINNHNMEKSMHAQMAKKLEQEADLMRKRENDNLLNGLTNSAITSGNDRVNHKMQNSHSTQVFTNHMSLDSYDINSQPVKTPLIPDVIYNYTPLELNIFGPTLPTQNALISQGYIQYVRKSTAKDLGGGYTGAIACSRALHDAFGGLLVSPSSIATDVI